MRNASLLRAGWLLLAVLALVPFLLGVPAQVADASRGMLGVWLGGHPRGRLVTAVIPGMPAERAGIRAGEVIVTVNGRAASGGDRLSTLMGPTQPRESSADSAPTGEETAALTILGADGRLREVTLTAARPSGLPFGLPQRAFALLSAALDVFFVLAFAALGTLIVWSVTGRSGGRAVDGNGGEDRRRRARFAVLVALTLLLTAARIPPELYLLIERAHGWGWLSALLAGSGYVIFPLLLGLFPNGRWVPGWLWVYPLFWLVYALLINLAPGALAFLDPLRGWIDMGVVGFGLLAQAYRYRQAATPVERQQTKWALYGILVSFVLFYGAQALVITNTLPRLFPILQQSSGASYVYTLFSGQYWLALLTFPVALVISILRFRLWEIDVLIRKTLVYTLITSLLALVYFGTVLVLESLLRWITGASSALVVVLSTLAITLLFAPVRRAAQEIVDRRFYRPRYNAVHAAERFTSALREEVDLERITGELARVVDDTLQPEQVAVWVRRGRRD